MESFQSYKNKFWNDGFIKIPSFLNEGEVVEIRKGLLKEIKNNLRKVPDSAKKYRESKIEFITNIDKYFSSDFNALLKTTRFENIVQELLGTEGELHISEVILKRPKVGLGYHVHQDDFYFCVEGHEALNVWIPLNEVSPNNGGIYYFKGSHKQGLLNHQIVGPRDYSCIEQVKDLEKVEIYAMPGDIVIHHCLTAHGSSPNISSHRRTAISRIYKSKSAGSDQSRAILRAKQDIASIFKAGEGS